MKQEDLKKEKITVADFNKVKESIQKTEESDTPYAVATGEEVLIVGDANKTDNHKHDYKVLFRFPKDRYPTLKEKALKEVGNFYVVELDYEDVTITPRQDTRLLTSIMTVLPFINKIKDDGSLTDFSESELVQLVKEMNDEIVDALYDIVKSTLLIDSDIVDFMLLSSVVDTVVQITYDFPEVFMEADAFFGL